MATTRLSDVIIPSVVNALVNGAVTSFSRLRAAGVISTNTVYDAYASAPGVLTTFPFVNAIAWSEGNTSSDDPTVIAVPDKLTQAALQSRKFFRNHAWASAKLVEAATGFDTTQFVIDSLARYWADEEEYVALAELEGMRLKNIAANGSDMFVNKSITTGTIAAANKMSIANMLAAKQTLGDAGTDNSTVNSIIMHSDVYYGILAGEANAFVPASKTDLGVDLFAGNRVIVSERVKVDRTVTNYPVYYSYIVGPDMFAAGVGDTSVAIKQDELAANGAGVETVVSRRNFVLQPKGHSMVGTPASVSGAQSFSNTELGTAATWARVNDRKTVPLAIVATNG